MYIQSESTLSELQNENCVLLTRLLWRLLSWLTYRAHFQMCRQLVNLSFYVENKVSLNPDAGGNGDDGDAAENDDV